MFIRTMFIWTGNKRNIQMNILLVDDDVIDRATVRRALRHNKDVTQLIEVCSAEEGLQAASSGDFDVLLIDYLMPQIDGIEMVIELRSRPNLGETAIIMMSTSDDDELALACLQAGAQDFITKKEITASKLKRAMVQAKKRFELEKKLYDSFCQVRELAEKDSLTGLSNRYHFEEALKISIDNNKRTSHTLALLLLDLDHFKNVNDTYGHDVGDKLLKHVVAIVAKCLRGNELFARLGGDEFSILISNLEKAHDATLVARRIIDSLEEPIEIDNHLLQCGVSVGISLYPQNASSAEELTKYADIAMYRAKKLGRNQLCYFEEEMQLQFSRNYQIDIELKEAVKHKDFELHYQPVINSKTNNITGVEALIRWPTCSITTFPDEFILIAEQSNVIHSLGVWVLETAVKQLADWQQTYNPAFTMAVNISAVQLGDELLVSTVSDLLERYKIPADSLILELTETALLLSDERNNKNIVELGSLGCRLALDDFGTGFSSLSHLINYPISIVKLDKSLLPNSEDDLRHLSIVEGVSAMVNSIGLDIIAEGVETQYQLNLCHKFKVNEIQGYFFDKARPAADIESHWLIKTLINIDKHS